MVIKMLRHRKNKSTYSSKERPIYRSSIENLLDSLTPDNIQYTGDGKVWIQLSDKNKNPDFACSDTGKLIECHGDYWHRGENSDELIEEYKKAGRDCLVIWEHELKNKGKVLEKVAEFLEIEEWQLKLQLIFGRNTENNRPKKRQCNIQIEPELYSQAKERAKELCISLSRYVTLLVEHELETEHLGSYEASPTKEEKLEEWLSVLFG